ncbi:MAG: hypothetical protein U5L09_10820 [Bacteroidales bacterium]|nr:hypothetical protein [Bacteroidales bacterium]
MSMNQKVENLWPELEWIKEKDLREKTARTWELALERSILKPEDLNRIPFTLLVGPHLKVTFMDHKRSVIHIARDAGQKINDMYHGELSVDMDDINLRCYSCRRGQAVKSMCWMMKGKPCRELTEISASPVFWRFTGRRVRCAWRKCVILLPHMPAKAIW